MRSRWPRSPPPEASEIDGAWSWAQRRGVSTIAYAAMTTRRDASASGTSTLANAPGIGTYVDALAALVPAEVLSLHAAVLSFTTETVVDAAGKATVTITEPATLAGVFYALIVFSVLIYVVGRVKDGEWDRWDYCRVLIPPLAFVGWTMLQKATAFDAVAKDSLSPAARSAIAILGAAVLGAVASVLGGKADRKQPPKAKAPRP